MLSDGGQYLLQTNSFSRSKQAGLGSEKPGRRPIALPSDGSRLTQPWQAATVALATQSDSMESSAGRISDRDGI